MILRNINKIRLLLVVLLAAMPAGCGQSPAGAGADISVDEALQLWQNKEAVIIDVRTPGEYRDGHIPGVVNITGSGPNCHQPHDSQVLSIPGSPATATGAISGSSMMETVLQKKGARRSCGAVWHASRTVSRESDADELFFIADITEGLQGTDHRFSQFRSVSAEPALFPSVVDAAPIHRSSQ